MSFLSSLSWRYATKKFDPSQKVSEADILSILESIRLAPTSFGLQAFHVHIVQDRELLAKIQWVSWNQSQIGTASELLVFSARNDLVKAKEDFFSLLSNDDLEVRKSLEGYEQMVDNFLPNSSPEWAKKQVYIALWFAMAACAELHIDSCPMEGFDPVAVKNILELPQNLDVAVMLPVGYRDDSEHPRPKVRFSETELFTRI